MKLRNKKTGEIVEATDFNIISDYNSLAELNEVWEDYWYINEVGDVIRAVYKTDDLTCDLIAIGNHFESKEEAEKAVEKLKAWKRLKDKGFRFERWLLGGEYGNTITFSDYFECDDKARADLDLLFGGEE